MSNNNPSFLEVPESPLTDGEKFVSDWMPYLPVDVSRDRARHILKFLHEAGNESKDVMMVLKYMVDTMEDTPAVPSLPTQKQFRMSLARVRAEIYKKWEYRYVIYSFTREGAYIPEMDIPCKSFLTVINHRNLSPMLQTATPGFPTTEEQWQDTDNRELMTRIDGLRQIVWKL